MTALAERLGGLAGSAAALTRKLELEKEALEKARSDLSGDRLATLRAGWELQRTALDVLLKQEAQFHTDAVLLLETRFGTNLVRQQNLALRMKLLKGETDEALRIRGELDTLWKDQDKTAQQLDQARIQDLAFRLGTKLGELAALQIKRTQLSRELLEVDLGPAPALPTERPAAAPASPPPTSAQTLLHVD
jgi:hypothetical protein